MADQTNRIQGPVEIQNDCDGRVAFDMVKYYYSEAGLEGKGIEEVARLFGLFVKIQKMPGSTNDHISNFMEKRAK